MSSPGILPPPPPPPPLPGMADESLSDADLLDQLLAAPSRGDNGNSNGNSNSSTSEARSNNAHQKRSTAATRSRKAGNRVPPPPPRPPPPPPPRRVPPQRLPHSRMITTTATSTIGSGGAPPKRRRPIPPPPPPPPPPRGHHSPIAILRMSVDSSEELASKAREMFHKCLHRSIPTGNLYSGGLGVYYLLLEQSRYHLMVLKRQQQLASGRDLVNSSPSIGTHNNRRHSTPFRCKRLLKQALEGAQTATNRFKRSNSSNLSHQRSCISLLGGEWVGSHTLLAVCYRRLEDFSERQQQEKEQEQEQEQHLLRTGAGAESRVGAEFCEDESSSRVPIGDNASSIVSPITHGSRNGMTTGTSLFARKTTPNRPSFSSSTSVFSLGGASVRSSRSMRSTGASTVASTVATMNPRPRSQQVVDRIFYRIEKQHLAVDEDDDNMTHYTSVSNITTNTVSSIASIAVAPVWNQDVLGGRAGALHAIWWLRKEFDEVDLGERLVVSLASKILEEGLSTASSMGFHNDLEDDCYGGSDSLFWVCDSQGSHKAYLGAARGVVGILHTLLGLSHGDWELVEREIPNARRYVRNTIDIFLPTSAGAPKSNPPHELFLYNHPASSMATGTGTATATGTETQRQYIAGNLRPRLEAAQESDTTVEWSHGATGLAMLFLEASKVFRSKEYLQEAHRLCDSVIFPRGLIEQRRQPMKGGGPSNAYGSNADRNKYKGPVGLAGMAVCFLQLSQLCSNDEIGDKIETEAGKKTDVGAAELSPKTSLKELWKIRAAIYAQNAHQEWANYLKATPTVTSSGNVYSLYEGMGGLISILWQLSLSTLSTSEESTPNRIEIDDPIGVQMPLYGLGFVDSSDATTDHNTEPIVLSFEDVTLSETPEEALRQPKIRMTKAQAVVESRKRRAAAEAEARRRAAQVEEAEKARKEQAKAERAVLNAQRRADLEARKKAQALARKKALEIAKQKEEEESKNATNNEAEEQSKRESLLLARKQAKERVEAKCRAKEEEELAKVRAEAQRIAIDAENKIQAAEEEAKKRRALAEARLRRQRKQAEFAKQREEERNQIEEADRVRRAEMLKQREEVRKQRLAELRLRQLRASHIAKEKEKERLLQEQAERENREKQSRIKKEERNKQDAERRRRLEILKERERRKKEEHAAFAKKKTSDEQGVKSAARRALDAKEKRRLQLREGRLKKQRELQENQLRMELQQALDKEIEKQRRESKLQLKAEDETRMQETLEAINNGINKIEIPQAPLLSPNSISIYSPSFAEKKSFNPAHFSASTKSSLFWSLQSDSNIGNSDSYKPALVASDSQPSRDDPGIHDDANETRSEVPASSLLSSQSSSPGPVHLSAGDIDQRKAIVQGEED